MERELELPDENTMIEILEEARLAELAAREMAEMAFSIAYDTQKRIAEFRAEEAKCEEVQLPTSSQ